MVEKIKEQQEEQGSNTYNISLGYVTKLILDNMVDLQEFLNIAVFGATKIEADVFMTNENLRAQSRLKGLKRAIYTLINIIRAGKFIVKKNDIESFKLHVLRLLKIEKNCWRLRLERKKGRKLVELSIDEDLFDKIFDELNSIIDEVNRSLNSVGIIFSVRDEETDPHKIKEAFKEKYRGN